MEQKKRFRLVSLACGSLLWDVLLGRPGSQGAGPWAWGALGVAGLTEQLREILARVPPCEVELDREVTLEAMTTAGNVVLDGRPLIFGNPDGFALKDARHLEIRGKACDALRAAGKQLCVRVSCD